MNNIIYDPNFIPNQPVFYNNGNSNVNEERLIPFLGGALIGGLGGAAIANNQGYYGGAYYTPYYQPYGYYYPANYYYSYPVNTYYPYPQQQTTNVKRS